MRDVRIGQPGIKKIEDLDNPDVTFGSVNSAAMMDRAKRYASKAKPMYFDTDSAAFQALKSRRVSAVQADSAMAEFQVGNSKGAWTRVPGQLGSLNGNAIFMKPGDFQLWLCLDTIVGEYVHGSRYDEYKALYTKWFGAEPPPARFYSAPK